MQARVDELKRVFRTALCLLADNGVDLLPDIPYTMPCPIELGAPPIIRLGNRDAERPPPGER